MYEKCLLIVLISMQMSNGYERDTKALKSFDNYPMKVSYFNLPSRQPQQPHYGRLFKVKSAQSNQKHKREHNDNVKGDLIPQSRRDIHNIKKLSFHGRISPLLSQNVSASDSKEQQQAPKPTQRNDLYSAPQTKAKKPKPPKKNYSTDNDDNFGEIPPYVPDNSPFYPLMKPSPINVMPTEPPSFDTVRSYVQYLKMRRHKYFSDLDEDIQPESDSSKHTAAPYEGEIDYFKEREQELVREEEQRNQFSPTNYITSADDVDAPYKDDSSASNESEMSTDVADSRVDSIEFDDSNENHYYADNGNDESKMRENFVPFRLYAQVRHVEAENHAKKPTRSNVREKVTLAKKNVYYKEEGHDDKDYDHGAEKINYGYHEKRGKRPRQRSKRSADEDIDVSELPVALAYIKKSELPELTGEKLFKHLDDLVRNKTLGNDRPVRFKAIRPSKKYPNYNFSDKNLPQMSAHRYSENQKNHPKQSLYDSKNVKGCEDIQDDINPAPKDVDKDTKFNDNPKRLNNLGDKIQCFRDKYFGKDPFDNPLFHEDEYVEATIPIPINHNLSRQANPLITVYDDVINNIRSGILSDFKKKREAEDVLKEASDKIAVDSKNLAIPNYSSVAGIAHMAMFDINNFLPKFKGSIVSYSDDDETSESAAVRKKRKRNNLLLENQSLDAPTTESPKVKRKSSKKSRKKNAELNTVAETPPKKVKNTKTSSSNQTPKYRKIIAPAFVKHIFSQQLPPPLSNGKTTYRFKLL